MAINFQNKILPISSGIYCLAYREILFYIILYAILFQNIVYLIKKRINLQILFVFQFIFLICSILKLRVLATISSETPASSSFWAD